MSKRKNLNEHLSCLGGCKNIDVLLNRFGYCKNCQMEIDEDARKNGASFKIRIPGSTHAVKAKDWKEAIDIGIEEHMKILAEAKKDGMIYSVPDVWKPVKSGK